MIRTPPAEIERRAEALLIELAKPKEERMAKDLEQLHDEASEALEAARLVVRRLEQLEHDLGVAMDAEQADTVMECEERNRPINILIAH